MYGMVVLKLKKKSLTDPNLILKHFTNLHEREIKIYHNRDFFVCNACCNGVAVPQTNFLGADIIER